MAVRHYDEGDGQPCQVCEERTSYCCSDCAIDGKGKVYVCTKEDCRDAHERDHDARAAQKALDEPGERVSLDQLKAKLQN